MSFLGSSPVERICRFPSACEFPQLYYSLTLHVACFSAPVQVRVEDVNEYVPAWEEEEYSGEVGEGEMRDPILTLTTRDSDCSPTFGSVCSYSITREDAIIMRVSVKLNRKKPTYFSYIGTLH